MRKLAHSCRHGCARNFSTTQLGGLERTGTDWHEGGAGKLVETLGEFHQGKLLATVASSDEILINYPTADPPAASNRSIDPRVLRRDASSVRIRGIYRRWPDATPDFYGRTVKGEERGGEEEMDRSQGTFDRSMVLQALGVLC